MCNGKCSSMCTVSMVAKILLIVGGINWGLVGLGMVLNADLNIVHLILGSIPAIEAIVYILVGVAAIMKIFGCKCKKCMNGGMCTCGTTKNDAMGNGSNMSH